MAKNNSDNKPETAIKSDIFQQFRSMKKSVRDEKAQKAGIEPDDASLYELSGTDGWDVLKQYIRDQIEGMQTLASRAIEEGADFDDIGKIMVVSSLASEKLEDVINHVEGTADIVKSGQ